MRIYLSALYRSTVGFDSLASMLDEVASFDDQADICPPYNIERLTDNEYRITMTVAGFDKEDVEIEVNENILSIRGEKKAAHAERTFLHRGIASRAFERRFQLADHVEVSGADVKDGLLIIELNREVPERLKSRMIQIGASATKENKTIAETVTAK
jgi:molecular chaperone IbpA